MTQTGGCPYRAPPSSIAELTVCATCVHISVRRRSCASMNAPPISVPTNTPTNPMSPTNPTAAAEPVSSVTWM